MALLQRTRILSNEREDLLDYNNIEDFVCADFKAIHKNVWTDENYVMSGFEATGIGTDTLVVAIANSEAMFAEDDGMLYIGAPSLDPLETDALVASATNYVEIQIDQDTGGADFRVFWDPNANSGQGAEFSQIIDTFMFAKAVLVVNTLNFSGDPDKVKLCEVDVNGSGVITAIRDARNMFWRLGRYLNATFSYAWGSRVEPANTDFTGADKDLKNFKDWADAVMTSIKEVKGTTYWFEAGTFSFANVFRVAAFSAITPVSSGAKVSWNGTALSITDSSGVPADADAIAAIRAFDSVVNLLLTRQDGTGGSAVIPIAADEVLWVELPDPLANRTYDGVGVSSTNFRVSPRGSVPFDDTSYWLAYREGSVLIFRGIGELQVGEASEIGDNVPTTLLTNLGLASETAAPSYSSNIRGTAAESLVARLGVLTDAVGDEQEDRSAYLRSNDPITWTDSEVRFTSDIILEILNTKSGTLTQHTISTAQSPIALTNGESAWVLVNRNSVAEALTVNKSGTLAIPAQTQANKDVFILFRRVNTLTGGGHLHIPLHKQVLEPGQVVKLGLIGDFDNGVVGDDLTSLLFKAAFKDIFNDPPASALSAVNISAGFTDQNTYQFGNKLYRLAYDASKTVTGVGTAMTISATPTFTVKAGDMLVVGSEARKITVVTTQTSYTIESAFSSDPSVAACTISQAVHTVDLNNHAADGLPVSSAFSTNVDGLIVNYKDTSTLDDVIADVGVTPHVAFSASGNGSAFSNVFTRTTNLTDQVTQKFVPTPGTNLYLRFFANKTSGSGSVNLLEYKVMFHTEVRDTISFAERQAYCFTDGVGTEINCLAPFVSGGKTRVTLNFSYATGVAPGTANGQLALYLNGQKLPRFVDGTLTPDGYYKEINSNTIELDDDYSGYNLALEVIKPRSFAPTDNTPSESILEHNFTLTSVQILSLNTSPVTILPAPPAGMSYVIMDAYATMDYNSIAYTSGGDLQLRYLTSNELIVQFSNALYTGTTDKQQWAQPWNINIPVTSEAVKAMMSTSNPLNGNSDVKFRVRYRLVPNLL